MASIPTKLDTLLHVKWSRGGADLDGPSKRAGFEWLQADAPRCWKATKLADCGSLQAGRRRPFFPNGFELLGTKAKGERPSGMAGSGV